jgi:hypothetical protein
VYFFLDQHYVVHNLVPFDEAALIFWDDAWKDFFEPGRDDFCDQFVASVAEGNWAESVEVARPFFFRYQR